MYGLLLESIAESIRKKYGEQSWNKISAKAGLTHHTFGEYLMLAFHIRLSKDHASYSINIVYIYKRLMYFAALPEYV